MLSWVDHSENVIGRANDVSRLSADMEAGMRGYLLSGDREFLEPYMMAKQRMGGDLNALARLVDDNPAQLDRVRRIRAAQQEWQLYAEEAIARRSKDDDVIGSSRAGAART